MVSYPTFSLHKMSAGTLTARLSNKKLNQEQLNKRTACGGMEA